MPSKSSSECIKALDEHLARYRQNLKVVRLIVSDAEYNIMHRDVELHLAAQHIKQAHSIPGEHAVVVERQVRIIREKSSDFSRRLQLQSRHHIMFLGKEAGVRRSLCDGLMLSFEISHLNFRLIIFVALCFYVSLSFNFFDERINKLSKIQLGSFQIYWDSDYPYLLIKHISKLDKVLFETLPSWPFITVGFATSDSKPIVDGNYKANEWTLFETPYQNIKNVMIDNNQSFIISGELWGLVTLVTYELMFYIPTDLTTGKLLSQQLAFKLTTKSHQGTFNRVFLNYRCYSDENFYGFGTQYTHWNLKGRRIPILVAEQGIGRGLEPITSFLNFFGDRSGGDWSTTYAPKPLYITNYNRSIMLLNSEMTFFDTRDDDSVVIEVWGDSMIGRILYGESMLDLITEITYVTGRMSPLPQWTQKGAIVGLEGGTNEVHMLTNVLLNNTLPVAIAGIWLQDWVGLRTAHDGDRLNWNWQLDHDYYPDWLDLVLDLQSKDIRMLSYINPFFSSKARNINSKQSTTSSATTSIHNRRNLYQEGMDNKYFVQSPNHNNDIENSYHAYVLYSGSIEFCMVDFTNPMARIWMKDILKQSMIIDTYVSGWMADFGEYLPFDAILYDGTDAAKYHNIYPQEWAKLNQEAIQELKLEQEEEEITNNKVQSNSFNKLKSIEADDIIYFMRSAWLQSPNYTSVFWLGDQLVSWDKYDGIKSVLISAISSGVGGHSLTHSDIGGYTMHDNGPVKYMRSKELLFRWIELGAFGSALFRTHIGLITSNNSAQVYDDEPTMTHFAIFTNIFAYLEEYRNILIQEANLYGWPLMRQMAAHYAYDSECWELTTQYMFGSEFMVAPVLDPAKDSYTTQSFHENTNEDTTNRFSNSIGIVKVKVYIPKHTEWIHLWTGQHVTGGDEGKYINIYAPIGAPPIFYTTNSKYGYKLKEHILMNNLDIVCKSMKCNVSDYIEPDWYDWLGIKKYLIISSSY